MTGETSPRFLSKGHNVSPRGTYCLNCNEYVSSLEETLELPECKKGNIMAVDTGGSLIASDNTVSVEVSKPGESFTQITPITPNSRFDFSREGDFKPLLCVMKDGTVIADKLEESSESARIFIAALRAQLGSLQLCPDTHSNDEILNKTEDLHLLSKIIDAYDEGRGISKCVSLIHAVRQADRDRIEELERDLKYLQDHPNS